MSANIAQGTTSAHAENTQWLTLLKTPWRNYLRARGEYVFEAPCGVVGVELPPRTRRIQFPQLTPLPGRGTTSAHAENTEPWQPQPLTWGNYLRARGEYRLMEYHKALLSELPPRTRRILIKRCGRLGGGGTTSAHAENTYVILTLHTRSWNYLRARGEYVRDTNRRCEPSELPPRTRRIQGFRS